MNWLPTWNLYHLHAGGAIICKGNNDLTAVSCVYEPLLQPGVLSLHSSELMMLTNKGGLD